MERFSFNPFSLVDSPNGTISSVVYTLGCNLRCPYCYNDSLVLPEKFHKNDKLWSLEGIKNLITARKRPAFNLSDYIVISGGEPLIHYDAVLDLAKHTKDLGLKVKVNTNGTIPLDRLIESGTVDYLSIDLKAPFFVIPPIAESLRLAQVATEAGVLSGFEVHTVLVRGIGGGFVDEIEQMARDLVSIGYTGTWYLAGFKFTDTIISDVLTPLDRLDIDEALLALDKAKGVYPKATLIGY